MGKSENEATKMSDEAAARVFGLKKANDWLEQAKVKPIPKMLFGEFWLEGELGVLFADTGKGKSILAVQIAEAIASGTSIGPIKTTGGSRTVLYLDCELTEKQFEMRYADDAEEGDEFLKNHYQFSDNFYRAQIDPAAEPPEGYAGTEDYLYDAVAKLATHAAATVLIVDNISFLQRSNEHAGAALALMRQLRRLKSEMGLSILVLAHTPKRHTWRPLTINDLAGFKAISNFADNVFVIGQSRIESDIRYIKHLKQRSTEMLCDERNVPAFRIVKRGGNFLSFEFLRFTTEAVHLCNYEDKMAFRRVAMVKKLSHEGMSQ
ncbi:MAG: AAA family ATPase [Candidatus Binatia bacterium]